ncbi:SMP-30/gluconolactonase/LRE family protein [Rhizobium sp. P38BS-XIX]|uniref:SMP-30/gluconolactonase/LRE family protein n=1 Tax=Rhizobium sp. P38BS-XIX TaxID=2726740 RepID=UPI0014578E28|nr:SMP-30/gluconolactonase/LRE family protein [Rhizobium sp. P38BS-XIX]NLS00727.1 SMP-30/gluconolactonase/LRE family protein [Rhizobium sp. P38BS-XIX]
MEKTVLIEDPRMEALLRPEAVLQRLCTGAIWSEGPVWWDDGSVTWSDIPNNRMLKWSPVEGMTVFRSPSNHTNGHTRDREGRMVSCEHSGRRISRTEADGTVVTVVDRFEGKRLNSPNDVVVKSDGTIWFTDPPYGIISDYEGVAAESEIGANYVYRFDPADGSLAIACDDFQRPNGLAFSPDESLLYVSDTSRSHDPDGNHHIRVFDIKDGRYPTNGRVFAVIEPGLSDGFRLDVDGNLFTSSADSIQVFAPDGTRLGKIFVPEVISNCTFGARNRSTLFITASTSLYSIELATKGSVRP